MQLLLHNATNSTTNHGCRYILSSRKTNPEWKALRATQQFLQFAERKLCNMAHKNTLQSHHLNSIIDIHTTHCM